MSNKKVDLIFIKLFCSMKGDFHVPFKKKYLHLAIYPCPQIGKQSRWKFLITPDTQEYDRVRFDVFSFYKVAV